MTIRIRAYTVMLTEDVREDDAESIENAIRMVKGVAQVVPHEATWESVLAEERAKTALINQLWEVLK